MSWLDLAWYVGGAWAAGTILDGLHKAIRDCEARILAELRKRR